MSQQLDLVLSKLEGVKHAGSGHVALCPAHEDRHPSLSVNEGEKGVLLKCHVGCTADAICKALGLTFVDLMYDPPGQMPRIPKPRKKGKGDKYEIFTTPELAIASYETKLGPHSHKYEYRDHAGELVGMVVRWDLPDRKEIRPVSLVREGWATTGMPEPRPLYGLAELIATAPGARVYVVEGEKTADAMWECGLLATTSPHGSQAAKKADWSPLAGHEIVLCPDNDAAGEKYIREVAESIPAKSGGDRPRETRLKRLAFPGLEEVKGGDFADFRKIRIDLGLDDSSTREMVERLADQAPIFDPASARGRGPGFTDLGNAERFLTQHGDNVRYCHAFDGWFHWTDTHWQIDPTNRVIELAKETVRNMHKEASKIAGEEAEAIRKHATRSESRRSIENMVKLAQSDARVAIHNAQLNQDDWLFCVKNGVIDLRTGELHDHSRDDLITKLADVEFVEGARHPVWDRFLSHATGGDGEVMDFLQRAAGYAMTGSTAEEVLFLIHGPAAAGKSTFIEAIRAAMGEYSAVADFETFLQQATGSSGGPRNDIAKLHDARFVSSVEVDKGRRLAAALIKWITGGDTISARFLFKESFEFKPKFKLFLVANHAPAVDDRDDAMWRRLLRIPFEQVVKRKDSSIKKTLTGDPKAKSAVLWWLVQGALMWKENELCPPASVTTATDEYRKEQDPLKEFMEDYCVVGPGWLSSSTTLRNAYAEYCKKAGVMRPISVKEFNDRLKECGIDVVHKRDGNYFAGIALRPPEYETPQQTMDYAT